MVVLDTCAIVWAVSDAGQLAPRAVCRPTRDRRRPDTQAQKEALDAP